jgi:hypothetical protein
MILNQLLFNPPLCITNSYYPRFSDKQPNTQFLDIDNLCKPEKKSKK